MGDLIPSRGGWATLFQRAASGGPPVRLVIAGQGPMRPAVEQFVAASGGRHRYLGFVQDIRPVLWAADLLVIPSRWEGFGLAAAEAMAAELPVVGTRIAGLSDVVVDGTKGLVEGAKGAVEGTPGAVGGTGGLVEGATGVVEGAPGLVGGATGLACRVCRQAAGPAHQPSIGVQPDSGCTPYSLQQIDATTDPMGDLYWILQRDHD